MQTRESDLVVADVDRRGLLSRGISEKEIDLVGQSVASFIHLDPTVHVSRHPGYQLIVEEIGDIPEALVEGGAGCLELAAPIAILEIANGKLNAVSTIGIAERRVGGWKAGGMGAQGRSNVL